MLDLQATLETRISKNTNKEYKVLVIQLPYGLKKNVFLEEAELKILDLYMKENKNDYEMPDLR